MRTLALSLALLILCTGITRAAEPSTCCICQTGADGPKFEKPFFKIGCDLWLDSQKGCDLKKRISSPDEILSDAQSCQGGTIKLGYVGHWYGSDMTAQFTRKYIAPLTDPNGLAASVEYDNTACSAMTNPLYLQEVIDQTPRADNQYIRIKGIQTTSFGEWKRIVPKGFDIHAIVDTRQSGPTYPSCAKIEGRRCAKIQESQQIVCDGESSQSAQIKVLTCMKNTGGGFSRLFRPYRWEVDTQKDAFIGTFSCSHQGIAGFGDIDVGASVSGTVARATDGEVLIQANLNLPNATDPSNPNRTTITGHMDPSSLGEIYTRFDYFDNPSYSEIDFEIDPKGQGTNLLLTTVTPEGSSRPIYFGSCTLNPSAPTN